MTARGRERNPKGEGGRLRDEIVDGAIAIIDEADAPPTLTLRGVARRARISAPSIYDHFDDLTAVIDAVLARSFEQLSAAVAGAIAAEDDPAVALIAAGRAYVAFGWTHRARYRMMFDATGYAPNAVETYSRFKGLLERCAETGQSATTDPHLDTWMLWAGLHGAATLQKPRRSQLLRLGPLDRPAMLDTIIRRLARLSDT